MACCTPWRSQFSVGVQRSSIESDSATDLGFGGKTRLIGGDDEPVAVTLAYGVSVVKAAGGRRIGEGFVNAGVARMTSEPKASLVTAGVKLGF